MERGNQRCAAFDLWPVIDPFGMDRPIQPPTHTLTHSHTHTHTHTHTQRERERSDLKPENETNQTERKNEIR